MEAALRGLGRSLVIVANKVPRIQGIDLVTITGHWQGNKRDSAMVLIEKVTLFLGQQSKKNQFEVLYPT